MKRLLILAVLLFAAPVFGDIVLTIPEAVRSEIGGPGTVDYDRMRCISISVDPQNNTLVAQFELYASSDNAQPAYRGTYTVDSGSSLARLEVEGVGFQTGLTLSGAEVTAVVDAISSFRDDVENSMISFGVVDGTQE